MLSVLNMAASYTILVLAFLCLFSIIGAKQKLSNLHEENGFNLSSGKEPKHSKEFDDVEVEEKLKGKINKAEKALEESLNQLMQAKIEMFLKDKIVVKKEDSDDGRITMKHKKRKEYCHAKALVYCGKLTKLAFLKAELEDSLDFSSRCEIKEQFLDCMTLMKSKSCKNLPDIDLTEDEFKHFRSGLMKELQIATGCALPIGH